MQGSGGYARRPCCCAEVWRGLACRVKGIMHAVPAAALRTGEGLHAGKRALCSGAYPVSLVIRMPLSACTMHKALVRSICVPVQLVPAHAGCRFACSQHVSVYHGCLWKPEPS